MAYNRGVLSPGAIEQTPAGRINLMGGMRSSSTRRRRRKVKAVVRRAVRKRARKAGGRLVKGSKAAKAFMAKLRKKAKRR